MLMGYHYPKAICKPTLDFLRSKDVRGIDYYSDCLSGIVIHDSIIKDAMKICRAIFVDYKRYQVVATELDIHPAFIGAIHYMECNRNWSRCLHNGEKWNRVTTLTPKGIGPFASWEDSTINALSTVKKYIEYNILESYLYAAERHNGFGYYFKGNNSPYIFSGTNKWTKGKFISDGIYDSEARSSQIGIATILITGEIIGLWRFKRKRDINIDFSTSNWHTIRYSNDVTSITVKMHQDNMNKMAQEINLVNFDMLTVDGIAGSKTSKAHREFFGEYLLGDPGRE